MNSFINCTNSSERHVQRVRLIYCALYRFSVKYFEFNLNKNIDFAARLTNNDTYGSLQGLLFLDII